MAKFKSKNIHALFVWFRLYIIKGHDGQWNIKHLKENLENAEKELHQLEDQSGQSTEKLAQIAACIDEIEHGAFGGSPDTNLIRNGVKRARQLLHK